MAKTKAEKITSIEEEIRRLATLKKHVEQSDIYFKYKGKKSLAEAEQIRKSVYNILRLKQREQQLRRAQDMER